MGAILSGEKKNKCYMLDILKTLEELLLIIGINLFCMPLCGSYRESDYSSKQEQILSQFRSVQNLPGSL